MEQRWKKNTRNNNAINHFKVIKILLIDASIQAGVGMIKGD